MRTSRACLDEACRGFNARPVLGEKAALATLSAIEL